jgi:dihydrofolate reductase
MTMSLDGFIAGPNNELEWMMETPHDAEMMKDSIALINDADTGVMGFPTGSGIIPYWRNVAKDPSSSDDQRELGKAISKLHGILVSNKEEKIDLENVEVLVTSNDDELVEAIEKLKRQSGKDIGVPGGVRTAQTMARLGLFDEYILMVHPVAIGEGKRLFTRKTYLSWVSVKSYKSGIMQMRYRRRIVK